MPSFSLYRVVVDQWEDYSEKSWKVWKGNTTAFFPKSVFEIGDMPLEFICDKSNKWRIDKLEEAAEKKVA